MDKDLVAENNRLKEKIDYLENIIENLPENVYWKDVNGVNLGSNRHQLEATGQDHLGKTVADVAPANIADEIIKIDREVINTGREKIIEERGLRCGGEPAIYLTHKIPLKNKQGKITGLLGISFDITERKKMEAELLQYKDEIEQAKKAADAYLMDMSRQITGIHFEQPKTAQEYANNIVKYLQAILDKIPMGIYWKDKNGIGLGCNSNVLKVLNLSCFSDYMGKSDFDLLEHDMAEKIKEIDKRVMSTNAPEIIEENGLAADGSPAIYLTHRIPLHDQAGNVTGILGVSLDITEKKALEEKMHQAEIAARQQEERIRVTKAFAGGIAHDLRTPLEAMINAAEGVAKFLPRLVESYKMAQAANLDVPLIQSKHLEVLAEALDHISHEGHYAQSVINMMLAAVRNTEIQTDDFVNLSMVACVEKALKYYPYRSAEQKDIVHFKAEHDFQFWGKDELILNILFNLIKNAIFFIEKARKGEITIWLENEKDKNILHVKDTSTGMAPDVLSHIFEDFYTHREGGTGIGLTFVMRAMRASKGDVTCHSVEREITDIEITFPIVVAR